MKLRKNATWRWPFAFAFLTLFPLPVWLAEPNLDDLEAALAAKKRLQPSRALPIKASAPRKASAAASDSGAGAQVATLVMRSDAPCRLAFDGKLIANLQARETRSFPVSDGDTLVECQSVSDPEVGYSAKTTFVAGHKVILQIELLESIKRGQSNLRSSSREAVGAIAGERTPKPTAGPSLSPLGNVGKIAPASSPQNAATVVSANTAVKAAPTVAAASAIVDGSDGTPVRSLPHGAAVAASQSPSSPTVLVKGDASAASGSKATTQPSADGVHAECLVKAQGGDKVCQLRLASAYLNGRGLPQDYALAMRWYQAAADQGDAAGQTEVGLLYMDGRGVRQNSGEAIRWFRKAAAQNYAAAENWLGWCYERGLGINPNPVIASDWYRKSADQGFATAQNNLGRAYLFGIGVFKDRARAKDLLDRANVQGSADAAFNLGYMFETGAGVSPDPAQAAAWYRTAFGRPNLHVSSADRERAKALITAHP